MPFPTPVFLLFFECVLLVGISSRRMGGNHISVKLHRYLPVSFVLLRSMQMKLWGSKSQHRKQKSILKVIEKLIDFRIDCLSIVVHLDRKQLFLSSLPPSWNLSVDRLKFYHSNLCFCKKCLVLCSLH